MRRLNQLLGKLFPRRRRPRQGAGAPPTSGEGSHRSRETQQMALQVLNRRWTHKDPAMTAMADPNVNPGETSSEAGHEAP